ncbi:Pfs NB-ARC ankyrin domain-containing protein [Fusarium mexicanum]|uniref:Pfs NB-ARC ankyrin domain-containing protein n=1 Tax=Fusarium mexicanum TaxID=751941 RepID=A0A8H5MIE8_9HYPO|nr:Pfs NB-ARC ankyrin domain-containing protein [Fusarium mexicanum]
MEGAEESLHAKTLKILAEYRWDEKAQETFLKIIWPRLEGYYKEMVDDLKSRCEELINKGNISGMVEGRVKSTDSIKKSLDRRKTHRLKSKQANYNTFEEMLDEIHDLAGIRIVVDYPHELEKASDLVASIFLRKKPPNIFKADRQVGNFWQAWFGAYECVNHHITTHDADIDWGHYTGADKLAETDPMDPMLRRSLPEDLVPLSDELRQMDIKEVPAQVLQQAFGNFAPRPEEAARDAIWDSVVGELRFALEKRKDEGTTELNKLELRDKAIAGLKFSQMSNRELQLEPAHENTCRWILENPEYKAWLHPNAISDVSAFFWIKGKAGSGKSTTMNFLYDEKRRAAVNDTVLSFFFNARGHDLEKSVLGLYRSVLLQLYTSEPDLKEGVNILAPTKLQSLIEIGWQSKEPLRKVLEHSVAIRKSTSPIYLFIDALDECPQAQIREMLYFFELLTNKHCPNPFRFCFASRPYPNISLFRCAILQFDDAPGHIDDIRLYTDFRSKSLDIGGPDADLLKDMICRKASGIFLWVVLVIPMLQQATDSGQGHSLSLLAKELDKIPEDLNEVFRRIILEDGRISETLYLTLQWTLFAPQPLTPNELYAAICPKQHQVQQRQAGSEPQEIIERFIMNASKGLVEVTRSNYRENQFLFGPVSHDPQIQFIHESVKDFLLGNHRFKDLGLGDQFEGQSHDAIVKTCASQLGPPHELSGLPLYEYATKHVFFHANKAQEHGLCQKAFLENFDLESWIEEKEWDQNTPLLYVLAKYRADSLIRICPDRQFHLTQTMQGGELHYPIFAALSEGHHDSFNALFDFQKPDFLEEFPHLKYRCENSVGSLRNIPGYEGYEKLCCPIPFFLRFGSRSLVQRILETNRFDTPCRNHDIQNGIILGYAKSEGMIDLWFKYSRDLGFLTKYKFIQDNGFIASRVARSGNKRSHDLMSGLDPSLEEATADTAHLLKSRILRLVKPFKPADSTNLEHVYEAISRCPELLEGAVWCQQNIIKYAFSKGFDALVDTAISYSIDSNNKDFARNTAIEIVRLQQGDYELRCNAIRRLADASMDLDGPTLLQYARREEKMVNFLLHDFSNFDINGKSEQGETALCKALTDSCSDNFAVIERLIEAGAVLHDLDNKDSTALHCAVSNISVLRAILGTRDSTDAETIDRHYCPAFHRAIQAAEINIEATDRYGRTAMHVAVEKNVYESVTLLAKATTAIIDCRVLNALVNSAEKLPADTLPSCEVLRTLLNIMKERDGGVLPSRDILPFKIAKSYGRNDLISLMESFLQGKDLSRPIDKLEHMKLLFYFKGY